MKRFLAMLLTTTMVLGMIGCGADKKDPEESAGTTETAEATETTESSEPQLIKIAWCDDILDSSRAIMLEACEKRVAAINEERDDIQLELTYYEARGSVDQQISNVETAILTKPDVFIFSYVDAVGSLPCIQMMKDTGAYVIDVRDIQSDLVDVVFYGSDEVTYKQAAQSWVRDYLEANLEKNLKVGLIYGAAAQTAQLVRCDLMKELAEEMPDRIEIVTEAYGDWDTQKAMNITEDWIQAYPELNFICCANDIMALGASNALVSAGIKDDVILTGVDLDGGGERIAEGKQDLDVGSSLPDFDQVIDLSVMLVEGTWNGGNTYVVDGVMRVDKTNADKYVAGDLAGCRYSAE